MDNSMKPEQALEILRNKQTPVWERDGTGELFSTQKRMSDVYPELFEALSRPAAVPEWSIRWLQTNLPWTIRYSRDFRASPMPHKDFAHALHHVSKAAGKLHGLADDMDHDRTVADGSVRQDYGKYVADLVVCALRLANTMPGGVLDLQQAVVDRIEGKNGEKLPAAPVAESDAVTDQFLAAARGPVGERFPPGTQPPQLPKEITDGIDRAMKEAASMGYDDAPDATAAVVGSMGKAEAFGEWAHRYGLWRDPNFSEQTEKDCNAAFDAGVAFQQFTIDALRAEVEALKVDLHNAHVDRALAESEVTRLRKLSSSAVGFIAGSDKNQKERQRSGDKGDQGQKGGGGE